MTKKKKLYPIVGNTIGCCFGHFLCGPQLGGGSFIYLVVLVIGGLSFWSIYVTIPLWLFFVEIIIGIIPPLYLCFKVHTSDPGILPRGYLLPKDHPLLQPPEETGQMVQLPSHLEGISVLGVNNNNLMVSPNSNVNISVSSSPFASPSFHSSSSSVNSFSLKGKFCETCQIYRPAGAKHCYECDNCVMGFDHHCPVFGNCIGERNQGYFSLFLLSCCFGNILILITGLIFLIKTVKEHDFEYFLEHHAFIFGSLCGNSFLSLGLGGGGFTQACFICHGTTTTAQIYAGRAKKAMIKSSNKTDVENIPIISSSSSSSSSSLSSSSFLFNNSNNVSHRGNCFSGLRRFFSQSLCPAPPMCSFRSLKKVGFCFVTAKELLNLEENKEYRKEVTCSSSSFSIYKSKKNHNSDEELFTQPISVSEILENNKNNNKGSYINNNNKINEEEEKEKSENVDKIKKKIIMMEIMIVIIMWLKNIIWKKK